MRALDLLLRVAEFKKYLIAAKESGEVQIEGKMRDYIASAVGVSTGKAAQMESITNNLCEEGKEAFKNGKMNFTTAYETCSVFVLLSAAYLRRAFYFNSKYDETGGGIIRNCRTFHKDK